MSKLKGILPNLFGSNKSKKNVKDVEQSKQCVVEKNKGNSSRKNKGKLETDDVTVNEKNAGKLETDAMVVKDDARINATTTNGYAVENSIPVTPTVSTELTASAVRELSDPNYNSMEMVQSPLNNELAHSNGYHDPNNVVGINNTTLSPTMNVHNAQQQVVMQFSNVNKLHFGSIYNFNNNINNTVPTKGNDVDETPTGTTPTTTNDVPNVGKRMQVRKTTSVVAMMQSQEEPNHRILDTIATHLGEGWKQVMRYLGHSDGQIEQALIDHQMHGGIKEVIYQLLLQWLRNADDNEATLGYITVLLWENNHRDCVQRMKLVWKSAETRKTSR